MKSKKYPKIPTTPEELKNTFDNEMILDEFGKNLTKKFPFFIHGEVNDQFSYQIFASNQTIEFIKRNIAIGQRKYLIDGTFKVVPKPFSQLLIISIEYILYIEIT